MRRTYAGTDSKPVTPSKPIQIPLKMDLGRLPMLEGTVFQFSEITSLPSLAQWMIAAMTSMNMVRQWNAQMVRVTPLLSLTPRRNKPVNAVRMTIARMNSGKGSEVSPPMYWSIAIRSEMNRTLLSRGCAHRGRCSCRNDTRCDPDCNYLLAMASIKNRCIRALRIDNGYCSGDQSGEFCCRVQHICILRF